MDSSNFIYLGKNFMLEMYWFIEISRVPWACKVECQGGVV